jgi:hypothetical protein
MPPMPPGMPAPAEAFSGASTTIASVVRMFLAIDAAFWSAERVTMVGSMMPALTMATISPVSTFRPWPFLAERTWLTTTEPGVVGELPERLLQGAHDDPCPGRLVAFEQVGNLLDGRSRVQERDAAAGHDALLEGRPGRLQGVLDPVLLLLQLGLGRRADLDHRDAAGQLRQPLLQLLTVEIGVGVLDLRLQLLDPRLDRVCLTSTVDDRGRVLVDDDAAGVAELR